MNAVAALDDARRLGFEVRADGPNIRLRSATGSAVPPDLIERLRAAKPDILAALSAHPATSLSRPMPSGPIGDWQRAFSGLPRDHAPCPGFRRWPAVRRAVDHFFAHRAEIAVSAGWEELDLFGVHAVVGTIRLDCAGALMVSNGALVTDVTRDAIRFANKLTYRRQPRPPGVPVVPIWSFGR